MRFAPQPENDFNSFIQAYYNQCRHRFDKIEGIGGKWTFRDLMPGMSDFDTRFILADDMTADDWCRMSTAIGDAHLMLCRKYPAWARNLEHLPGINVTWWELASERFYYPEYQQWSFYHSQEPHKLQAALGKLAARPWDYKDEYFHLKKFCLYFGRYDRQIDPAINLGIHANKYPLHSRLMHYFTPPVHSATIILQKRHLVGKHESLEAATEMFPRLRCWDTLWEILHDNYESPKWYQEPHVTELEDMLEEALVAISEALREEITLEPKEAGVDIAAWKKALAQVDIDPALQIFDNAKFSRLMKGRLYFYAHAPQHFDFTFLIQNELGRIGTSFFTTPFRLYWQLLSGESVDDPADILDDLRGELLSDAEVEASKEFHRLTPGHWRKGKERQLALAIVEVYDDFYRALVKISDAAVKQPAN